MGNGESTNGDVGKLRPGREDSQEMGPYQAGLAGGAGGRIPLRALGGHAELGLQRAVLMARGGGGGLTRRCWK